MDPTYRLPAPIEVAGVYWDPEILDSDKGLEVVKAPDPLCPEHRRLLFVGDNNKYRCLTKDCPFVAPFNSSQIYNVWKELGNEIRGNYRVMDGKLVAFKFGVRN